MTPWESIIAEELERRGPQEIEVMIRAPIGRGLVMRRYVVPMSPAEAEAAVNEALPYSDALTREELFSKLCWSRVPHTVAGRPFMVGTPYLPTKETLHLIPAEERRGLMAPERVQALLDKTARDAQTQGSLAAMETIVTWILRGAPGGPALDSAKRNALAKAIQSGAPNTMGPSGELVPYPEE